MTQDQEYITAALGAQHSLAVPVQNLKCRPPAAGDSLRNHPSVSAVMNGQFIRRAPAAAAAS
jgi:hypothetical protein